jgi:hypothetical protein
MMKMEEYIRNVWEFCGIWDGESFRDWFCRGEGE